MDFIGFSQDIALISVHINESFIFFSLGFGVMYSYNVQCSLYGHKACADIGNSFIEATRASEREREKK